MAEECVAGSGTVAYRFAPPPRPSSRTKTLCRHGSATRRRGRGGGISGGSQSPRKTFSKNDFLQVSSLGTRPAPVTEMVKSSNSQRHTPPSKAYQRPFSAGHAGFRTPANLNLRSRLMFGSSGTGSSTVLSSSSSSMPSSKLWISSQQGKGYFPCKTAWTVLSSAASNKSPSSSRARTRIEPKTSDRAASDGLVISVDSQSPGAPIVFGKGQFAGHEANPECLNLDKRGLAECPNLEGRSCLRLLNFENNHIAAISNIKALPNLIFLDLYNNRIRNISGLESVPTLRVLLLGKNQIRTVENLHELRRLDVLDLHSNRIDRISNVEMLTDLRVLNLAGNEIEMVNGLENLVSLTELNLRRNRIHMMESLDANTALLRVFLSHNQLKGLSSLDCLVGLPRLSEIALEENPLSSDTFYRQYMMDNFHSLRILDGKRISADERRMFVAIKQLRAEKSKASSQTAEGHIPDSMGVDEGRRMASLPNALERGESIEIARGLWFRHRGRNDVGAAHTYGSFHELVAKKMCLALYGRCLDVLTREKLGGVRTICFHYVNFNEISPYLPRLSDTNTLSCLRFADNDFHCFYQIDTLSVLTNLIEMHIHSNTVIRLPYFLEYLVFRVPSLQKINGIDVTGDDRVRANTLFGPLKRLWKTSTIRRIKGFCPPLLDYVDRDSEEEKVKNNRLLVDLVCSDETCFDYAGGVMQAYSSTESAFQDIVQVAIDSHCKMRRFDLYWASLVQEQLCSPRDSPPHQIS